MSGLITFQRGPYKGWRVNLYGTWQDGALARTTVEISPPPLPGGPPVTSGLLSFKPGIPGWLESVRAEMQGGPDAMAGLLEWIIESTAEALHKRTDIPIDQRRFWQDIVDTAGQTRAAFFARYPDGNVPPFEAVALLIFDPADDALPVAAGRLPAAPAQAFPPAAASEATAARSRPIQPGVSGHARHRAR
jgi:hypothetical protein